MFGAAAALLVAPSVTFAAPMPPSPDVNLLTWCRELDVIERRWRDAENAISDADWEAAVPRMDAFYEETRDQQAPLLNLICANPPQTIEGVAALAASLVLSQGIEGQLHRDDRGGCDDTRLTIALLSGLTAWGAR